ncbi:E3 ubiquitin-protein ligase Topors-like protein [Columba guinea]|nr:hypothetical protein Q9233_012993 [Columba guinea]KAK2517660.1 E3 ubiquitin-protein ligase Topors-like protein [Columba guinea]
MPSPPSSPEEMASPDEQGAAGPQAVGGLLPEVWAELFQRQEHLLDPVLPWLRQQLEAIYGSQWWLARSAESTILHALCIRGLDGDAMVQMMQDYLEEYTEELVHGVISIISPLYALSNIRHRMDGNVDHELVGQCRKILGHH